MPIDPVNNNMPVSEGPAVGQGPFVHKKPSKDMEPDDFIKLFLTQLRNQNPMKPTDSSAILQQMSELSQIKASKDMQTTLADLKTSFNQSLGNSQIFTASQLIGKQVQVRSSQAPLIKDKGVSGSVQLPDIASSVTVVIKDSSGKEVKKIDLGGSGSGGVMDFKWDGMVDGKEMPPGEFYNLSATATIKGKEIDVPTNGNYTVNSVAVDKRKGSEGNVILNIDGLGGKSIKEIVKIV